MWMAESSSSETMRPAGYWLVSSSLLTLSPVVVVVAPIRFTTTSWLTRGLPRQFCVMGRKQTVLDLVPLAGPRWEVAHRNFQSRFIREFLQLELPEAQAIAIAATGIGRNQQAGRLRVHRVAHAPPPTADALHRKRRRIMVDPHTDPRFVLRHVIDPVRGDSA